MYVEDKFLQTLYAEGYPIQLKYAWNFNMAKPLFKLQEKLWFTVLLQGSIKSFKHFLHGNRYDNLGKKVEYFLITRRSWKKGGTRYNSRGLNIKGQVANFCET